MIFKFDFTKKKHLYTNNTHVSNKELCYFSMSSPKYWNNIDNFG